MKNKLIVYDGNCKVCVGLRDLMVLLRLVRPAKCQPFQRLSSPWQELVSADRFRNEMALVGTSGGQTLYGAQGVAFVFAEKIPPLRPLFRIRPLFLLFQFLYKTLAFNRYIVAIPRQTTPTCDCYPASTTQYRLVYIGLTVFVSTVLTALFGASVKDLLGVSGAAAAGQLLLMAGTGWVLLIGLAALLLPRPLWLEYVGHLGSIMVAGLLVLVPSMVFYFLTEFSFWPLPALSVLCSSGLMLHLHRHRTQYLGLPARWTFWWFGLLQAGALFWIVLFHV